MSAPSPTDASGFVNFYRDDGASTSPASEPPAELTNTASAFFSQAEEKLRNEENGKNERLYRQSISVENPKFSVAQGSPGSADPGDLGDFLTTAGPPCAKSGVSLSEPSMFSIIWKNVNLRASPNGSEPGKLLIRNSSGYLAGGLHAVLSQSGGGKTMLMNLLAKRLDHSIQQESGTLLLNGQPYTASELKSFSSYIMQGDALNPNLTVLETMKYAAYLKCPASMTQEQKDERVVEILNQVGLYRVRDVIVGDPLLKGISGGERRRLCVAVGLVHKPKLIFADEPTTGLDSSTSFDLIQFFRRLTRTENVTILVSLHQPSSKIFRLFDGCLLMKSGEILYSGSIPSALSTFEKLGFPCASFTNPADHLFDVMSDPCGEFNLDEKLAELQNIKIAGILEKQLERLPLYENKWTLIRQQCQEVSNNRVSWFFSFKLLVQRAYREQLRLKANWLINMIQTIILAVLIGTVFLRLDRNQDGVGRRSAVLFFVCVFQGVFGSISMINSFPHERNIILRERADGAYGASAYFLSKSLVEIFSQCWSPLVFALVTYFLIGLEENAGKFFLYALFMILCSMSASSLSLAIVCVARTASRSIVVLPMIFEITRLFGGFFLSPAALPDYFSWLDALSYLKYSYVGLSLSEFDSIKFDCPASGPCLYPSGQQRINELGLDYISIGGCVGSLIAINVGLRAIAYTGMRFLKN